MEHESVPLEDQDLGRWFIQYKFMLNPEDDAVSINRASNRQAIMDELKDSRPIMSIDENGNWIAISMDFYHTRYGALTEGFLRSVSAFEAIGLKHVSVMDVQMTDIGADSLSEDNPYIDATAEAMELEEELRAFGQ